MKRNRQLQLQIGYCLMTGFLLYPPVSFADYVRTGPVTGTVCTGIGIEFCSQVPIVAIKENGRFYEVTRSFGSVDEYNGKTCSIRLRHSGIWTPLNWLFGKVTTPDFYTREDGKMTKVAPDYVRFKCAKRP